MSDDLEITAIAVALIGVLAGVLGGATNQGIAWARERRTLKSERAHQARLRQEQAHDFARSSLGEVAADLADWIDYRWSQAVGPEFDYYKHQTMRPRLGTDAEASAAVWTIARRHPTLQVRTSARRLAQSLDSNFFSDDAHPDGEVSSAQFSAFSAATDALIELIQSPMPSGVETSNDDVRD